MTGTTDKNIKQNSWLDTETPNIMTLAHSQCMNPQLYKCIHMLGISTDIPADNVLDQKLKILSVHLHKLFCHVS